MIQFTGPVFFDTTDSMQPSQNSEICYVLKAFPYKERDVIAVLLSEKRGRFSALARNGVQSRRFGGSLDLFTCSEFALDPKTIRLSDIQEDILVQVLSAQIKRTPGLAGSFEKLSGASALNEIILKVIPPQRPAPEIFKLYSNALLAIEEFPPEQTLKIVNAFILKITQWLGVQPSLTRCLACEKSLNEVPGNSVSAQVAQGAWICDSCRPDRAGLILSKDTILDAYHSMLNPIRKIEFIASTREHEEMLEFLEKHLQYFVPGLDRAPIGALRFLKLPQWQA